MAYLLNSWYCVGWTGEVAEKPKGIRVLDEYLVIYRGAQQQLIASSGRCPHRFAPLDEGVVDGDCIQCPYHGLQFDAEGECVLNPHGDGVIPPRAKLRSYPTAERNGAIWVWMGDVEQADAALLPPETEAVSGEYSTQFTYLLVRANYQLVIDNLLDLTHAPFLHQGTLAADLSETTLPEFSFKKDGDVLQSDYLIRSTPPAAVMQHGFTDSSGSFYASMRWRPAATLELSTGMDPHEGGASQAAHLPSLHYLTPETESTTHYFVAASRNWAHGDAAEDEYVGGCLMKAFLEEDEPMIRKVESLMGTTDLFALKPAILQTDISAVQARRLLAKKIESESSADLQ